MSDTMTAAEFRQRYLEGDPLKANKYHAKRTRVGDVTYDSRIEAVRMGQLRLSLKAGEIRCWSRQPQFKIGPTEITYRADFLVVGIDGAIWVEDVKGHTTERFALMKQLWPKFGEYPLHVLHRNKKAWDIKILETVNG